MNTMQYDINAIIHLDGRGRIFLNFQNKKKEEREAIRAYYYKNKERDNMNIRKRKNKEI